MNFVFMVFFSLQLATRRHLHRDITSQVCCLFYWK